jgi:hypothetical protein
MAYVLECGQFTPMKREYSYTRLAQATSHQMQWKQVAICDELQPLKDLSERMPSDPRLNYRITGVGEHCQFSALVVTTKCTR